MSLFYSFATILIGGALYNILEVIWRGYTHPSMALLGGICFLFMFITEKRLKMSLFSKAIISAVFITFAEFISGCVLNISLKLSVWDYSDMPYNIAGQVCLPYFFLWFILSLAVLPVIRKLRLFWLG